jgi:probable F420-dependent oxidoreductase
MAAAAATTTLRVGSFVLANELRNPVLVAREIATIDLLSGGRVELGLGAGRPGAEQDSAKLGLPFGSAGERVGRLEEALKIVHALFAGETVDAPGTHYPISGADLYPRPSRRPPILVAASGPRMLRLAARYADSAALAVAPTEGEESVRRRVDELREAGGEQLEICMNLMAVGAEAHPAMVARYGLTLEGLRESRSPSVLLGDVDAMADELLRRRETLGVSYLVTSDAFMETLAPVVARLAGR